MWKDRDYVQLNCMTQNYNRWVPKQGSVQCCYITLHPQGATMAHGIHTSRKLVHNYCNQVQHRAVMPLLMDMLYGMLCHIPSSLMGTLT